MVLPTENANRELRDWRTGLAPSAGAILRQFLEPHPGVRGPYETENAVNALARVGLHLLARVEDLEARLAARQAAPARAPAPPEAQPRSMPVDVRAWKRAEDPEPAQQETAPKPPPKPSTGAKQSMPSLLLDLIDQVLDEARGRWWMPKEICAAILATGRYPHPLSPVDVSQACTTRWKARSWLRRGHPVYGNRLQYSLPVVTSEDART